MEVSVIMSEYNTESEVLMIAIKSILNQTYKEFEFIIVNDGTNQDLNVLVNELDDKRIKLINNDRNLGLAKSLNKAIDISNGNYIVRMDTDDFAHPSRIEKQLLFIKKHPEYSVVGTSINILTEENEKIPNVKQGEITKELFLNRHSPVHPTVIMKKKDIIDVGKYKTVNVQRCEDFVLWAELLLDNKRIYIMEDILLDYRVTLNDYKKRKLSTRLDEIKNRLKYYRKLKASPFQFFNITKSILSAIMPNTLIARIHRGKFKIKKGE